MSNKQKTTATVDAMGVLHNLTAMTIAEQINYYRNYVDPETGKLKPQPVPPALLAQAIKLLKDNNITAHEDDPKLKQLKDSYEGNVLAFPFDPNCPTAKAL